MKDTFQNSPKIVIFTIESSFFYPHMWQRVLEKNPKAFKAVFLFQRLPSKFNWFEYKIKEANFLGFKNIVKLIFRDIAIQLRHLFKHGSILSVKSIFQKNNIPVYKYRFFKDQKFKEKLKEIAPDLVISIGTHQVIPQDILDIPHDGILNKHGSLLPKYPGFWPLFWALYNNEEFTGVTIHKMLSKVDAGEIIHQRSFKIEPDDTLYSIQRKSLLIAADMVCEISDFYLQNGYLSQFCKVESKQISPLNKFPQGKDRIYLEKIIGRKLV